MASIDQKVIGELRSLETAGSPGFLGELIDLFLLEGYLQMKRLREAYEKQEGPRFERAAHLLKGSSGNLGAKAMSRICGELQQIARSADWGRVAELLPDLEEEFRTVKRELEEVRHSRQADPPPPPLPPHQSPRTSGATDGSVVPVDSLSSRAGSPCDCPDSRMAQPAAAGGGIAAGRGFGS